MKKIIAINAGPRKGWNTDTLINETIFPKECDEVYRLGLAMFK